MDLQLEKFAQQNVKMVPDNLEMMNNTELTQYFIQTWSLDYNDPGEHEILILRYYFTLQAFP